MKQSTQETFENDVSNGQVVVDFYADWCGPCKQLTPIVEEIDEDPSNDITGVKVDIEDQPELANRFEIRSIPTLMYYQDGEVLGNDIGVVQKDHILGQFDG